MQEDAGYRLKDLSLSVKIVEKNISLLEKIRKDAI
jgi:hypothetical protein